MSVRCCKGIGENGEVMIKILEYTATVIMAIFLAWMLISWVDVINHNSPFDADGGPSGWNAFVILTEVME